MITKERYLVRTDPSAVVFCNVLQCVAVWCSAVQCAAVYRSVVHDEEERNLVQKDSSVAVCCMCCSVLQCAAACRDVAHDKKKT